MTDLFYPVEAEAREWLRRCMPLALKEDGEPNQEDTRELITFARSQRREGTEARDREYADALGIPAARDTMSPSFCARYVKEATALAEHEGRISGAREMQKRVAQFVETHYPVRISNEVRAFWAVVPESDGGKVQSEYAKSIRALPDEPEEKQ